MQNEDAVQINVINWFKYNYPDFADDVIHIANQRTCSMQQGRLLKRLGVKKGASDLFFAIKNTEFAGLWLELKTKQGKLSKEQQEFLERKRMRGYCAMVAYGEDEAKEIIQTYLAKILIND